MQRQNGTAVFKTPVARGTMSLLVDASEHMPLYDEPADMPLYDEQADMPYHDIEDFNTDKYTAFNTKDHKRNIGHSGTLCLDLFAFKKALQKYKISYDDLKVAAEHTSPSTYTNFWNKYKPQNQDPLFNILKKAYSSARKIALLKDTITQCIENPLDNSDMERMQRLRNQIFLALNANAVTITDKVRFDIGFWTTKLTESVGDLKMWRNSFIRTLEGQLSCVKIAIDKLQIGFEPQFYALYNAVFPKPQKNERPALTTSSSKKKKKGGKKSQPAEDSTTMSHDMALKNAHYIVDHPTAFDPDTVRAAENTIKHHAHLYNKTHVQRA